MSNYKQHPASYRDPAGFIFEQEAIFYRQINQSYADSYSLFKKSGLYDLLVKEKRILAHTEIKENLTGSSAWHMTLLPQQLPFITYPYEWCFSEWKDAALLTLGLVKTAMQHGMILKDATPFNVQFVDGAPVLIDSLSFEKYDASKPWIAYRQFTECFLAPLLLARYQSADMLKLFLLYPDGIPLRLVSKLLPFKSFFNANVFLHVRLPGMVFGDKGSRSRKEVHFSKEKLFNIINSLYSFINKLSLPAAATQWNNYYEETILSNQYAVAKMDVVKSWLNEIPATSVLDIGANTGLFSLAAAAAGKFTVAVDADIACIERLYNTCIEKKITNLVPLCADMVNPVPSVGWNNGERSSFVERAKADIVMALALIHHLAISKNISFEQMAESFSRMAEYLIIEFVPKSDPKVALLLQEREDIFTAYNELSFLKAFEEKFVVLKKSMITETERMIFLMRRR